MTRRPSSLPVAALTVAVLAGALVLGFTGSAPASAATAPIVPGHSTAPTGGTNAVGAGIDLANQNAQLAENIPASVSPSWQSQVPLCPQAGGSDATSISVVGTRTLVIERQYQCSFLSAYDTATGKLDWRRNYHFAWSAVVDGSLIFLAHDNAAAGQNYIDAVDIATGTLKWTNSDGNQPNLYASAIGSGIIVNGTEAANELTGAHRFSLPIDSTWGASLISGGQIFYNSDSSVQAFSATTGKLQWTYPKSGAPGWGNMLPAVHNGLLYITSNLDNSDNTTIVLDPATGKFVRGLPIADQPIAFDGNVGIFSSTVLNQNSIISAVNLSTGAVYWTRQLPTIDTGLGMTLWASPVIENGLVWMMSGVDTGTHGHLLALDEVTGVILSTTLQSCAESLGNLAIAQHTIITPSDCGPQAFVASKTTTPPVVPPVVPPVTPPTTATQLLPDAGFESGVGGWQSFTVGTLARVSTPVHAGASALRVTPVSATAGIVGITQNSAVTASVAGKAYTASCWVRPTAANQTATIRMLEYTQNFGSNVKIASAVSAKLSANAWTLVSVTGSAVKSAERVIPQVYSTTATTATGTITYDDCSLTAK